MSSYRTRILNQRDKLPVEILQDLFNQSQYTLTRQGTAYVWLCFKCHNGGKYGYFTHMKESLYNAHKTKVTQRIDGHLVVEVLDVYFDSELKTTIPELRGVK